MAIRKSLHGLDGTRRKYQSWKQLGKRMIRCPYWFKIWWTSIMTITIFWGIWHMNSKMLCINNLFLRGSTIYKKVGAIIIWISLQRLKELVILTLAWTICSFRATGQSILCWTHTYASRLITVLYTLLLDQVLLKYSLGTVNVFLTAVYAVYHVDLFCLPIESYNSCFPSSPLSLTITFVISQISSCSHI